MYCAAENCENLAVFNSGLCSAHYQRYNLYGRLHTVCNGQSFHPLYDVWHERKQRKILCEQWLDFWQFIKDVGNRPEGCFLGRINRKSLYGPDNFKWQKIVKKKENETNSEFQIRRRLEFKSENPNIYRIKELDKNFGITIEQYNEMLNKQNGVCKICKEKEKTILKNGEFRNLAVDHCHITGKIRGLLCNRCNRVLGKIKDNTKLLDAMKDYLK